MHGGMLSRILSENSGLIIKFQPTMMENKFMPSGVLHRYQEHDLMSGMTLGHGIRLGALLLHCFRACDRLILADHTNIGRASVSSTSL